MRRAGIVDPGGTRMALSAPIEDLDSVGDVAALLHSRLARLIADHHPPPDDPVWMAGVQPRITVDDAAIQAVADQTETMIRARIEHLSAVGVEQAAWVSDLGARPEGPAGRDWDTAKLAAACYRDAWQVQTRDAIGPRPIGQQRQQREWEHAGRLLATWAWTPQPPDHMHQDAEFLAYSDTDIPAPGPDGYDTEATRPLTPLTEWPAETPGEPGIGL
ncbi:MAG: hypothetical protein LBH48_05770 [Bifidobacteriaceae bacterium]|nr:hypothetical protein [Bifidobacteriaceae bacterium]